MKEKLEAVVKEIVQTLADNNISCRVKEDCTFGDGVTYPFAISVEYSMEDMLDIGIDVYNLAKDTKGVWWDWLSAATIVVGVD
jgi:hypothetical protein